MNLTILMQTGHVFESGYIYMNNQCILKIFMAGNQKAGDVGEKEFVKYVSCPNCGKPLMRLPKNYPLYDLQRTGCSFRAQVKIKNLNLKMKYSGLAGKKSKKSLSLGLWFLHCLPLQIKGARKGQAGNYFLSIHSKSKLKKTTALGLGPKD